MPSLDFTLPHWAYWIGLIAFPIVAMVLSRRQRGTGRYSILLGYLILITGGIVGLHRFYVKSLLGLVYTLLFVCILIANAQEREARAVVSDVQNQMRGAERVAAREEPRIEQARADIPGLQADVTAAEEGSFARRAAERRLLRAEEAVSEGETRLAEARETLEVIGGTLDTARSDRAFWSTAGGTAFYVILGLLLIDALLMPGMVRRANETIEEEPESEAARALREAETAEQKDDRDFAQNWIDRLSLLAGEFVSYWAVIAVIVYYYEVISRYVFNSPTSWAHEAMYLMFGMQYLIAGAYAMLTESHVRVDIFYAPLPAKKKAWTDLVTSIFFFIFAGTLLWTSYTFAMDALAVPTGNSVVSGWARGETGFLEMLGSMNAAQWTDPNVRWGEISFNEWEVPLWPMKWVMVLGGLLLILQGVSKVLKDIQTLMRGTPPPGDEGFDHHVARTHEGTA